MKLEKDHYYECCSIQGSWSADSNQTVTITYGNHREHLVASVAWDQELDQETIILTGKTDHGIAVWAKKSVSKLTLSMLDAPFCFSLLEIKNNRLYNKLNIVTNETTVKRPH
jgi:hypothetical protein